MGSLEAVIFDWGGTLTQWHDIDFHAESLALAHAVRSAADHQHPANARLLHEAGQAVWGRSRDHQESATVADLFSEAGLEHDPDLLTAYHDFWEPHTHTDPDVIGLFAGLRRLDIKVGVLSNTIWSRSRHEQIFDRDGVTEWIDGAVYSSEIPWTKPAPEAFAAAMAAVGAMDPTRCVYVGDRLFEDIWGARQVGMRTILVPHSKVPDAQRGHCEAHPDATVTRLADVLGIAQGWHR